MHHLSINNKSINSRASAIASMKFEIEDSIFEKANPNTRPLMNGSL